jgi:regulator of sigma E protease
LTWFYAFLAFAALVILHELGHFAAAKSVGMRVEKFSLFFPPAIGKVQRGETSYQIGAIPLGGYVKITGMNPEEEIPPEHLHRAYFKMPVWKRIVVIAAGPAMNILIAVLLLFLLFAVIGISTTTSQVKTVAAGSPAAGKMVPGDRVVAVNGQTGDAEAFVNQVRKSKCAGKPTDGCAATKPVTVTVNHDGTSSTSTATPRYDAEVGQMRLGLTFDLEKQTQSLGASINSTFDQMWRVTAATASLPSRVFNEERRKEIHGTAGTFKATNDAFNSSTEQTIFIIAMISLSLALVNLFPFLPLDGGHIFWALAEKVRGRPISVAVLERASVAGIALIAMLFVIGLSNDITWFTTGKLN